MGSGDENWKGNTPEYKRNWDRIFGKDKEKEKPVSEEKSK